jgi:hypothetical protein
LLTVLHRENSPIISAKAQKTFLVKEISCLNMFEGGFHREKSYEQKTKFSTENALKNEGTPAVPKGGLARFCCCRLQTKIERTDGRL